ncbi:Uma2 family endonuclease [Caldibacillus thermoamylovorans]|uniref:Uma2 family endonuclease n=1 Tax=Caldibacillus thermoamylovorans TaxID=35841 RepID=UPI00204048DA|nr:Uma2 family endonuclease [Caldibacillus thermoamylovorans]MCM3799828.1 Uma2 family endonuclease [Caldibacillus thermoamylovorans]
MDAINQSPEKLTYKEYATWAEGKRCEVLGGVIISMDPSVSPKHQEVSMQLSIEFGSYLRGKRCKVFAGDIDVYLFEDKKGWDSEKVKNWVIPDMVIVCDPDKIKKHGIVGAPDFALEILSPSSAKIDRMVKRWAYSKAGVKEYWIVDPANQLVEVYLLKEGVLELENVYTKEDSVHVHVLENLNIDLANIFPET